MKKKKRIIKEIRRKGCARSILWVWKQSWTEVHPSKKPGEKKRGSRILRGGVFMPGSGPAGILERVLGPP